MTQVTVVYVYIYLDLDGKEFAYMGHQATVKTYQPFPLK